MTDATTARPVSREALLTLQRAGLLDERAYEDALAHAGLPSTAARWGQAIDHVLGFGGAALLACGIVFFFAYNWADLHHFARFGLLGAGIVAGALVALWRGLDSILGHGALVVSAVQVGVLLAVYGQTYQTGADPYGLFLTWLVLITPWAIAARGRGMWTLWWVLANLALGLFWIEMVSPRLAWLASFGAEFGAIGWFGFIYTDASLGLVSCALNVTVLAVHEWLSSRPGSWLQGRALARAVACLALAASVVPTLMAIVDFDGADLARSAAPFVYLLLSAAGLTYYLMRGRDLFIVAALYMAGIAVVGTLLARPLEDNFGAFFLVALAVVAMATGAAVALRRHALAFERAEQPEPRP